MNSPSIPPYLSESKDAVLIKVHVQPRASKEGVAGVHGGALKLKVHSPPAGGAANDACIRLLSRLLGVPKRNVSIESGRKSRNKLFSIQGITLDECRKRLSPG